MRTWLRVALGLVAVVLLLMGVALEALVDGLCEEPGCGAGVEPLTLWLAGAGVLAGAVAAWPRRRRRL